MPGKKILMLTGEFTEEYEIFVYQQAMEAVGHTVHVVCPDKKAGDLIKTSLHDFEGDQTYTEKLGHFFTINKTFSEAEAQLDQYHAVYAAGGRGPEYIRTDKRVQAMVRHFHETRKPIFTICHGVQILIAVDGVVRGKRVGALGACEPEVTLAGGTYVDLSPAEALVDGTMVSAKGWTALAAFIRECLKVLGTEIHHREDVAQAAE
jgi:protease I